MKFNVHAGHGAQDSKSPGAVGLIKESIEDRKVKDEVISLLRKEGHTVYDCTVDYPSSQQDSKSPGAVGLIKESIEDRKVKDEVISLLRKEGHTVYDCTVDYPSSQQDTLNKIIEKCNSNNVDLDISIHFNSGANDERGNGNTVTLIMLI